MTERTLSRCLSGVALIAASGMTAMLAADVPEPAAALAWALWLASFGLAGLGLLLAIHSAWPRNGETTARPAQAQQTPSFDPFALPGSRVAMLALLVDRNWSPPTKIEPSGHSTTDKLS